jgi:hypothetical protein
MHLLRFDIGGYRRCTRFRHNQYCHVRLFRSGEINFLLAALLGVFSVAIDLSGSVQLAFEAGGSQQPNTHQVPRMESGQLPRISKKKELKERSRREEI